MFMDFIHKVIDNTCTTGCWVGAMYVAILWILVELFRAYLACKRRHGFIRMSGDENGTFMLSYKAVISYLKLMFAREYPMMNLKKIIIRKHSDGYSVKVLTQVSGKADIRRLSSSVHNAIQNTLCNVMGMNGIFTRIDIVVLGLRADGYTPAPVAKEEPAVDAASEPETIPAPVVADAASAPLEPLPVDDGSGINAQEAKKEAMEN